MFLEKKPTIKIVLWSIFCAVIFFGVLFMMQLKDHPQQLIDVAYRTSKVLPLGDKYNTSLELAHYALQQDDKERIYLILLQNNMELRPGGGYIGSFAIVKIKNGDVIDSAVHDTANFDGRIPDALEPPYPMTETMHISSWKLRDSNWMPDFPTNARVAENFYTLGGGAEKFDGVIAINATILDVILDITGPITLADYPHTFKSGDAIMALEYQVEKGYKDQDIAKGDRKVIMDELADEMTRRVKDLSLRDKIGLVNNFIHSLDSKDVQLFLDDERMTQLIDAVNWQGSVDTTWDKDYLMVVDANLASYKTDHVMKRGIDYKIDLSGTIPQAVLTIHYENTATQKDWKTNDYQTYVRVYAPEDTWFTDISGCVLDQQFGSKYGKRYTGCLIHVPLGTQKDIVLRYNLPIDMKNKYPYDLKIQKQSGVHNIPVAVHVQNPGSGDTEEFSLIMDTDIVLSDFAK